MKVSLFYLPSIGSREEIEQVVALSSGTLGMPSTVAAFSWVSDVLDAKE